MAVRQCHIFWALSSIPFAGEYITKEKFDKLMALLWEIMQLLMCLPRGMAELRGKAQHQMRCMERVRPFLVRLNQFIGGPRTTL